MWRLRSWPRGAIRLQDGALRGAYLASPALHTISTGGFKEEPLGYCAIRTGTSYSPRYQKGAHDAQAISWLERVKRISWPVIPLDTLGRGLLAGAIGTAAMTSWQALAGKLGSPEEGSETHTEAGKDAWDHASAPAKAAKRIGEGVFQREISAEYVPLLTNLMHWSYGTGWGAIYGVGARTTGRSRLRDGLLFGSGVWVMSYIQLVPMGLYQPPWEYAPSELTLDLSYHLVYGAAVAGGYALLNRA